jgi:hypothetical protein
VLRALPRKLRIMARFVDIYWIQKGSVNMTRTYFPSARNTLDLADYFDTVEATERDLQTIARFARTHGYRAHVTRNGRVLLTSAEGAVRVVKTMRGACEWMGY